MFPFIRRMEIKSSIRILIRWKLVVGDVPILCVHSHACPAIVIDRTPSFQIHFRNIVLASEIVEKISNMRSVLSHDLYRNKRLHSRTWCRSFCTLVSEIFQNPPVSYLSVAYLSSVVHRHWNLLRSSSNEYCSFSCATHGTMYTMIVLFSMRLIILRFLQIQCPIMHIAIFRKTRYTRSTSKKEKVCENICGTSSSHPSSICLVKALDAQCVAMPVHLNIIWTAFSLPLVKQKMHASWTYPRNSDLIQRRSTGILSDSTDHWEGSLKLVLENVDLRKVYWLVETVFEVSSKPAPTAWHTCM